MVRQTRQLPYLNFQRPTLTLSQPGGADYGHPLALPRLKKFCKYAPDKYVMNIFVMKIYVLNHSAFLPRFRP